MADMIHSPAKTYTVEEFWDYMHLPENAGRRLELVNGVLVEQEMSMQLITVIGGRMAFLLNQYVIPRNCGYITGPTAYFALSPKNFISPDIAYLSKEKHPILNDEFFPIAPDIAIEIIKPKTKAVQLQEKISAYADGGVRAVWEIYPHLKSVNIMYYPDRIGQTFCENDTIDCSDILPGFTLKVSEIFPK